MRSSDIRDEYLAAMRRMTLADAHELLAADIPIESVSMLCPAPTRVRLEAKRRYCPDPDGGRAHVFPVTSVDPARPHAIEADDCRKAISIGHIIDLMAVNIRAPGKWALRIGAATVLGAVEHQHGLFCEPVPIHRDVLDWLCSGCKGIVFLTPDPYERGRILRQLTAPQAGDLEHKAELDRLMTFAYPLRSIAVVRQQEAAA